MTAVLDVTIVTGPVRYLLVAMGVVALVVLVLGRGRRWWTRSVPLAVLVALLVALVVTVGVDKVWRPFPDPLPPVVATWIGLTVGAGVLALRRRLRVLPQIGALALVLVVALSGAAQVNQQFQAYPTLRAALGLRLDNQIDITKALSSIPSTVTAGVGSTLDAAWSPPADMPTRGVLTTTPIPGATSGFAARPAWIYLPPAYLTSPRPLLPVLVLMPGQPGNPVDWIDGGGLVGTMDSYAAAHRGLAPVVVVVDPLGSEFAQPLCVDGSRGNAFTYVSVDVPAWIRSKLQVDPDPRSWVAGGLSAGGTCALQLAVNAPTKFPSFLDISGEAEPTVGSRADTVNSVFGGNEAAFRKVNPIDVLASRTFPDSAGFLVVGRDDPTYQPQAQVVLAATRAAGMTMTYLELPGGHSFEVWSAALRESLPWLATRTGLTP